MLVVPKPADLPSHVGADLGETDWLEISQERINTFADATGDHQWIHVDVEKAKDGPFGAPIAHEDPSRRKTFLVHGKASGRAASATASRRAPRLAGPAVPPPGASASRCSTR